MTHNIQSVFYDLLDQHNRVITSDSVEVDINKPISELKRAVFSENDNKLPGCKATDLYVYPPGATDYIEQSECTAEDTIEDVLGRSIPITVDTSSNTKRARKQKYIILVARPPAQLLHTVQSAKQIPTVESLTEWFISLTNDPGLHLQLKADHRISWPLDFDNNLYQLTSRDDALINLVLRLFTRWYTRTNTDIMHEDRRDNPLLATHGSPGCGKSRFLDEVAKLMVNNHRLQDLRSHIKLNYISPKSSPAKLPGHDNQHDTTDEHDKQRDAEYIKFLQCHNNCIPITVTYNSPTFYHKLIDCNTADAGIALRVLLSYFYTSIGRDNNWPIIVDQFNNVFTFETLDLVLAYNVIQYHSKSTSCNVLLLVDELVKCSPTVKHETETILDTSNISKVMAQIGNVLSLSPLFSALVTTLDQVALIQSTLRSGRNIQYIQLKPIDGIQLFRSSSKSIDVSNVVVQRLISDCNGHPLTLTVFSDTYHDPRAGWPALLSSSSLHPNQAYYQMLHRLTDSIYRQSRIHINPTINEVVPALLCMKIQLSDKVVKQTHLFRFSSRGTLYQFSG